jgi:Fe-S oxidoreductase/nitrate reductase gamma subunit
MFTPPPTLASTDELTREVFGNVPSSSKALFYVLALAVVVIFALGLYRRVRIWRRGQSGAGKPSLVAALKWLVRDVLLQRRVLGRGLASVSHILLFSGFIVLLIGTTLIAVEHVLAGVLGHDASDPVFHKGAYFAVYEVVMDAFGIALLAGCVLFVVRRVRRPASVSHNWLDWAVLATLFGVGITGYVVEGLRILHEPTTEPHYSFVGNLVAQSLSAAGTTQADASTAHLLLWWLHAALALGLIAAFPYTRLLHSIAGGLNLLVGDRRPLGEMVLVTLQELEQTGTVGVGQLEDFEWHQLLELDACVSCGRCEEVCPAHEDGHPLSPKALVQDVREYVNVAATIGADPGPPSLHGETISADTVWSCTTCAACVDVCPLGVRPLGLVTDLRRFLVADGQLRGSPATSLQKVQRSGNPWGLPAADRMNWADGLDVPTPSDNPGFNILYWVGCAASYDPRTQKVARSIVRLLQAAGVSFAVLGKEEKCTGEFARRMGDEFLFQELAAQNIETLDRYQVRKILTHCPHCLNSFQRDYPQLGGRYEVVHHSQFLLELIQLGKLSVESKISELRDARITYHDPCYLARVGDVVQPPRGLLETMGAGDDSSHFVEMRRWGRHTACCGAGGGRMWFDDSPTERIGAGRVAEVLATNADTVSVACPFCLLMIGDEIAARGEKAEVRDISELLVDCLPE